MQKHAVLHFTGRYNAYYYIQQKSSYLKQPSFPAVLDSEKGITLINLRFLWPKKQNRYNIAICQEKKPLDFDTFAILYKVFVFLANLVQNYSECSLQLIFTKYG